MKGHLKRNRIAQISASEHLPLWSKRVRGKSPRFRQKRLIIVHGFWPKSDNFDFGITVLGDSIPQGEQNDKSSVA